MTQKIAIITGASSGIGRAVALSLAEQKYHVVLLARRKEKLKELADIIKAEGNSASFYVLDVSNSKDVEETIKAIVKAYGQINVLFNNAGIGYIGTSDIDSEKLKRMIDINLSGAIYVANAVSQQMKKQDSGYIINLSSIAGKTTSSSKVKFPDVDVTEKVYGSVA